MDSANGGLLLQIMWLCLGWQFDSWRLQVVKDAPPGVDVTTGVYFGGICS